jgi:hypothetical protein
MTEAAKYLEESRGVEKSMIQDLVGFLKKLALGHDNAIPTSIDSAFKNWLDKYGSDVHFLRVMGETEITRLHLLKERLTAIAHHAQESARSVHGQSHGESFEVFIHAVADPEMVFSGMSERDYISPEYTIPVSHRIALTEIRNIETRLVLNAIAAETAAEVKILADAARKSVEEVVAFSRIDLISDLLSHLQGLLDDVDIITQARISNIERHFCGMMTNLERNVPIESPFAAIAFLDRIGLLERNLDELDSASFRGTTANPENIIQEALKDLSLLKVAVSPTLIAASVEKLGNFIRKKHPSIRIDHLTIPGGNAAFQRSFMALAHHSKAAALAGAAVAITGAALVPYIRKTVQGGPKQAPVERPPGFSLMAPFMMNPLLLGPNFPKYILSGKFAEFPRVPYSPINPYRKQHPSNP